MKYQNREKNAISHINEQSCYVTKFYCNQAI